MNQRARRVRQLRGGLALCLAVLLGIPPLTQLFAPVALQAAVAASVPSYAPDGKASRGDEPAFGLRSEGAHAGILPRLLHMERALAPPAPKALLPKLDASIGPSKPEQATLANAAGTGFHRSSVGTARTPTGPPS